MMMVGVAVVGRRDGRIVVFGRRKGWATTLLYASSLLNISMGVDMRLSSACLVFCNVRTLRPFINYVSRNQIHTVANQ